MPIGRSDHEERKERRIDSYLHRADKATIEADQQVTKARHIGNFQEFGQPILVGHHSEKRHRADIAKQETAMRKSHEEFEKADYYQDRADAVANNTAISSDNPEAIKLYKDKLVKLENLQVQMKAANAHWRKHKTMKGFYGVMLAETTDVQMKTAPSWMQKSGPYEDFRLKNNSTEIRRIKEKLETLEKLDGMAAEIVAFKGGELRVDVEINRVQFIFEDKPSDEARSLLKSNGFKWAPSESAWQRQRTLVAVRIAKGLVSKLEGKQ